jgi:hypothetical protein
LPFGFALDALAVDFFADAAFFAVAFFAMLVNFLAPANGVELSPLFDLRYQITSKFIFI